MRRYQCWECGDGGPMEQMLERVRGRGGRPARAASCGGIVKSATISFGQALVPEVIDAAMAAAERADLLLAVGSSLQVYPGGQRRAPGQGRRRPDGHRQRRAHGMDRFADAVLIGPDRPSSCPVCPASGALCPESRPHR